METALHGPRVDLLEGHAAAGDLRFRVAAVPAPGQRARRQRLDEGEPRVAREPGERSRRVRARCGAERGRETVRQLASENASHGTAAGAAAQRLLPLLPSALRP